MSERKIFGKRELNLEATSSLKEYHKVFFCEKIISK